MSYVFLKDRKYYEDIYDHVTVMSGRRNQKVFEKFYDKFFEIMPDEPKDSYRAILHLNMFYVVLAGDDLLRRYDNREKDIEGMMADDQAKDDQIAEARLINEPVCRNCGKTGLRLTDKMLHHRKSIEDPEEVLFMLKCLHCDKNTACWSDGTVLEHEKTYCRKCHAEMKEKDTKTAKAIITTYTCPSCKHSYKDKLDLTIKDKKIDPDFEVDRTIYCLHDEKARQELRDTSWRYAEMARMGKEWKEKEDNKHIYDAIKEVKKPKIAELTPLLAPVLEKVGYIEFSLDKPEVGRDVHVGFSCLDSKADREDYESRKTLKKLVDKALLDTNWRLMSDGISYRLGYLNGRLKAYENEEEIKALVMKTRKLKPKESIASPAIELSSHSMEDGKGGRIDF